MRKFIINPISGCLLGALVFVGIILITLIFLRGGVWLGEKVLPFFMWLARITFGVVIAILLPMAAFHKTRRIAASGLIHAGSIFGITLWAFGLVLTYNLWGGIAVLVGIFLLGVGVVPMAMLATLFAKMWNPFGQLIILAVFTFITRSFGKKLAFKLHMEEQKIHDMEIL